MSERPARCPFCNNTDLAPAGADLWSCVGSLGCGGVWDPAVHLTPPVRPDRGDGTEVERPRRKAPLRVARRMARPVRGRGIFTPAA